MLGTLVSLLVIGGVGWVFTEVGHFTGLVDEGSQYISGIAAQVDLRGLLLAGLVIGALGVLDDVTVTQTWAVWELADVDPDASTRSLFTRAMRIGRSHAASTVNTLVLAYVGATLPLMLVFSALSLPFGVAVSQEVVAQEVVRGLVGGLGIVAAVPVTTAIAALVAGRLVRERTQSRRSVPPRLDFRACTSPPASSSSSRDPAPTCRPCSTPAPIRRTAPGSSRSAPTARTSRASRAPSAPGSRPSCARCRTSRPARAGTPR